MGVSIFELNNSNISLLQGLGIDYWVLNCFVIHKLYTETKTEPTLGLLVGLVWLVASIVVCVLAAVHGVLNAELVTNLESLSYGSDDPHRLILTNRKQQE